jgi:hypothetical protein
VGLRCLLFVQTTQVDGILTAGLSPVEQDFVRMRRKDLHTEIEQLRETVHHRFADAENFLTTLPIE